MKPKISPKTKRIIKKAISWSGLFFFLLAAFMLYNQLSKYPLEDIKQALLSIPPKNLIYAGLASFFGYISLACYDFLALKYIKHNLAMWKWMLTGFIGFSVSNNAGHAMVSGGAVRYRMYTRWRFKASEIVKMITFSGFTYLFGCFGLIVVGYFMISDGAFGNSTASRLTTELTALFSAIGLFVYLGLTIFYKKTVHLGRISFKMPSFKMACIQVLLGAVDALLASFVLYFCLTPFIDVPFNIFIGVFIVAQVLGVFSQVPGGLGVFEGLFLFILPGDNNMAHLFGALIAYRIIYYLLPLVLSSVVFAIYEWTLRRRRKLTGGLV